MDLISLGDRAELERLPHLAARPRRTSWWEFIGSIGLPQSLLMAAGHAQVPESASVEPSLSVCDAFSRDVPVFPALAAISRRAVRPLSRQAMTSCRELALGVDGARQVHPLAPAIRTTIRLGAIGSLVAWAAPGALARDPGPNVRPRAAPS